MFDPIRPISPSDRTVPPVDLTILTPLEREQDKQRRERERQRRQKAARTTPETPQNRPEEPNSGIDVRV
jgi:hypothetical protein